MDKPWRNEEWLRQKYSVEDLSMPKIGQIVGVTAVTILYWMKKFGIPRRTIEEIRSMENSSYDTEECRIRLSVATSRSMTRERRQALSESKKRAYANGEIDLSYCRTKAWRQAISIRMREFWEGNDNLKSVMSERFRGENSPLWRGGISVFPYTDEFNEEFKQMVRARDGHVCVICWLPENGENLSVHHIDYVKKNTVLENCISLCRPCHAATTGNREYWQATLSDLMDKRLSQGEMQCL